MKMNDILKGKTRDQLISDFMVTHPLEKGDNTYQYEKDLKRLAKNYHKPKKLFVWVVVAFIWIFCASWMVQAGIAIDGEFFWWPISREVQSMLSFINIFWVILWFSIPLFIIILSIVKIISLYEE